MHHLSWAPYPSLQLQKTSALLEVMSVLGASGTPGTWNPEAIPVSRTPEATPVPKMPEVQRHYKTLEVTQAFKIPTETQY